MIDINTILDSVIVAGGGVCSTILLRGQQRNRGGNDAILKQVNGNLAPIKNNTLTVQATTQVTLDQVRRLNTRLKDVETKVSQLHAALPEAYPLTKENRRARPE